MMKSEEKDIDLLAIAGRLWKERRFVLRVALAGALLGVVVALLSPTVFTAECVMVPQTDSPSMKGNLGGLAAMAGISLDAGGQGEVLSPSVYPKIVASVPFQKELLHTPIDFSRWDHPITLLDHYTDPRYRKVSAGTTVLRYTVGLPWTVMRALRGRPAPDAEVRGDGLLRLTREEYEAMRVLSRRLTLEQNEREGFLSLSVKMPEALAAAEVAHVAQTLLQRYITEFKVQKVQATLDFIEERCVEAKADFEASQRALAVFRDANRNVVTETARIREERLQNEFELAFDIYSELARQREQTRIKLKETTPVFTVVEPVTVPVERSAPRRTMTVAVFLFLGLLAGCAAVLALPAVVERRSER